jgi:hypothetical protein
MYVRESLTRIAGASIFAAFALSLFKERSISVSEPLNAPPSTSALAPSAPSSFCEKLIDVREPLSRIAGASSVAPSGLRELKLRLIDVREPLSRRAGARAFAASALSSFPERSIFVREPLNAPPLTSASAPSARRLLFQRSIECWDEADEAERWTDLRESWEKEKPEKPWHNDDPEEDEPGVFLVSQAKNNGYDTFGEFVVVARSEADARATHPGGADSFTYRKSELERNEEWRNVGNRGPAPAWFLGDHDPWCHGAYVKIKRISDYKPPRGEEPEYGIITSSFRAG